MLAKSRALFIKEYNNKLFNWLVIFSLVMVVIGRFLIKFFLLEVAAWVLLAFLETYTRLFWSSESPYYNPVWHMQARPMGEGRQCDARGPMALGAHEYTYM